jgi:SynChlorMet cassette protein ScmC
MSSSSCSSKVPGYRLKLSNDSSWYLTSTSEELHSWLNEFAHIVELDCSAGKSGRRLIFSIKKFGNNKADRLERHLAITNGWKLHDMHTQCVWYHDVAPEVLCTIRPFATPRDEIMAMKNVLYPIYRESIILGGQLFHAALIEFDGKGIILAGMHGAGKSTCCSRLPEGWSAYGDDEQLVVRVGDGSYRAHSFPTWSEYLYNRNSGKSWNVQHSVPLSGVFFIEQADVDVATPLGNGEAVSCVNESTLQVYRKYWGMYNEDNQRQFVQKLFDNSCDMVKSVQVFKLQVTLQGSFWKEIERVLGW